MAVANNLPGHFCTQGFKANPGLTLANAFSVTRFLRAPLKLRLFVQSLGNCTAFHSHCALSALKNLMPSAPGPLAQAFTFRAFGAGN